MKNWKIKQVKELLSKYADVSKVKFNYGVCADSVNVSLDNNTDTNWVDSEKFRTDIHSLYRLLDWMFDYDGRLLTIYVDKDLL